jgi:hypothetical protein
VPLHGLPKHCQSRPVRRQKIARARCGLKHTPI